MYTQGLRGRVELSIPRLIISRRYVEEIVYSATHTHVEKIYIGVGLMRDNNYYVLELFECPNVSEEPVTRFKTDPLCLYRVFVEADQRGLGVVLLVHSHPAPPTPSHEDLKGMKTWDIPWLIVNSVNGDYSAWIYTRGGVREIDIEVVD